MEFSANLLQAGIYANFYFYEYNYKERVTYSRIFSHKWVNINNLSTNELVICHKFQFLFNPRFFSFLFFSVSERWNKLTRFPFTFIFIIYSFSLNTFFVTFSITFFNKSDEPCRDRAFSFSKTRYQMTNTLRFKMKLVTFYIHSLK